MLFFLEEGLLNYYELDEFIERLFEEYTSGGYLTYVEVNGLWYQCDDERVR
jgi:hypothetical protein